MRLPATGAANQSTSRLLFEMIANDGVAVSPRQSLCSNMTRVIWVAVWPPQRRIPAPREGGQERLGSTLDPSPGQHGRHMFLEILEHGIGERVGVAGE